MLCLPCGREIRTSSAASFVAALSTATLKTSLCFSFVQSVVYGLCHGEGFFHGSPCLATDDSLACVIATADFLLMALRWISKYSECQSPKRQGCLYPCQQSEATFDWPSRATTHRCILPFRSEFTPLDTLRFLFSPVSHPYRGNCH